HPSSSAGDGTRQANDRAVAGGLEEHPPGERGGVDKDLVAPAAPTSPGPRWNGASLGRQPCYGRGSDRALNRESLLERSAVTAANRVVRSGHQHSPRWFQQKVDRRGEKEGTKNQGETLSYPLSSADTTGWPTRVAGTKPYLGTK